MAMEALTPPCTREIRVFSPHAPFSDLSHAQFYGCRAFIPSSKRCFKLPSGPLASSRSKKAMVSLQADCSSPCAMPCERAAEQNLMKELADLKMQMKQKKKELKAQAKEKKAVKLAMKGEEKKKKQKEEKEGVMGCSSESSSSSEGSDCECESVNMKLLRQGQAAAMETLQIHADLSEECAQSPLRASASSEASAENKIEVCVGGKCKRAGSEQLLLALSGQMPDASSVDAVPCKCMGKCAMGINVKVYKEDTNPQHHSHVGVEDAGLILSHHFRLGRPRTGLPSLGRTTPERQLDHHYQKV